jgi:hypothetical protein
LGTLLGTLVSLTVLSELAQQSSAKLPHRHHYRKLIEQQAGEGLRADRLMRGEAGAPTVHRSSVATLYWLMSGSTFFNAAVGLVGHARGVREVNIVGKSNGFARLSPRRCRPRHFWHRLLAPPVSRRRDKQFMPVIDAIANLTV